MIYNKKRKEKVSRGRAGYFFRRSSATADIAVIPVLIAGSGTGANLPE